MADHPRSMRAIVLDAPGPPEALRVAEIPIPTARPGEVLIKVEAFGLNRSELHTRLGLADGVTFPRVLGIEATGIVAACPGGEYAIGQQVAHGPDRQRCLNFAIGRVLGCAFSTQPARHARVLCPIGRNGR